MIFKRNNNHKGEAGKLPPMVKDYMRQRYILQNEYLDKLRCFNYEGVVNGKEVNCLSVFDPGSSQKSHSKIKTKEELALHPELLIFQGYVDKQGVIYLADRRQPLKAFKAGSK